MSPSPSRVSRKHGIVAGCLVIAASYSQYFGLLPSRTLRASARRLRRAVKQSTTLPAYDAGDLRFHKRVPRNKEYDVCIVGAGLSGAVIAERYASVLDRTSLVMDVRTHIGGNCYDFREPHSGILMNLCESQQAQRAFVFWK